MNEDGRVSLELVMSLLISWLWKRTLFSQLALPLLHGQPAAAPWKEMSMPRGTTIIAAVLLAVSFVTVAGWAQRAGVIEGQILSATARDAPIVGALVTLRSWQSGEELSPREVRSDESGQFSFSDRVMLDHEYQLLVGHQDVTYAFARKAFLPEENRITVPVTVYDATNDDSVLAVERAHLIIDGDAEHLHVQEVHVLTNTSMSTYVATDQETGEGAIHFPLPPGAVDLEWLGGFSPGSIAISPTGFKIVTPFLPGTVEIAFSYVLPFATSPYVVEMAFPYAVNHLDVFVTANGIKANAPQLLRGEPIALQAGHYNRLSGDELPADTSVSFEFERPETSQAIPVALPASGIGTTTVIIIGVVIVLVLVVLVYPFIRRGRRKTE